MSTTWTVRDTVESELYEALARMKAEQYLRFHYARETHWEPEEKDVAWEGPSRITVCMGDERLKAGDLESIQTFSGIRITDGVEGEFSLVSVEAGGALLVYEIDWVYLI